MVVWEYEILKTLINNIQTFLQSAITAGTINIGDIKTTRVYKGYWNDPKKPPRGTYITIDEGGERTELNNSNTAQTRIYVIRIEFAIFYPDVNQALDNILDLSDQIKDVFELEANRQKDGMIWGFDIMPFEMGDPDDEFWRGRQVLIEYNELEDTYFQY